MEKFGLTKNLVDQVAGMLKTNKPHDTPLSEKIIRDNLDGKKTQSSFSSAYASIVAEERKRELERQAKFEQDAKAAHMRMGKSIIEAKEGTTPSTPREKELAAKKPPKDKITHADVLHARGVKMESIEKLVALAVSTGNAKRMTVSLDEQKEIVNVFTRSFLLSLDEVLAESTLDTTTRDAIKNDFHTSLFNSVNIGNAVEKINEAMKIVAVMKKHIKEPKTETPAAKEGIEKMTKTEEVVREALVDGVAAGSMEGDKHLCATKVMHREWKEGRTLSSQHAEPAEDGSIAWYDVMFEHGIEKKVATSDLEILVSESHMNHKKKK